MPERAMGPLFIVSDRIEELAAFYEGIVGLRATSREPGHSVWLRAGEQDIVVHAPEPEPGRDFTPRERGVLMWFSTDDDLAQVAERARQGGLPHWGPFDGGQRDLLYTLDPDGNMVGIYRPKR